MLISGTFLFAATLLAITPGPGIAYIVARTAAGGRGEGVFSTLGAAVGGMMHVLAAALGLSLLIAKSALAFAVVKYLGATYLVYLGIRILGSKAGPVETPIMQSAGARKAWRDGVIVEVLNVKTAMFFLAFIPQFVSTQHALAPQFILLGTICVALNSFVDLVAVFATSRILSSGSTKAVRQRLLSRCSGATMLVLGILVAIPGRES